MGITGSDLFFCGEISQPKKLEKTGDCRFSNVNSKKNCPKNGKNGQLKFEDDKIGKKEEALIRGHAKKEPNNSFDLLSAGLPPSWCKASYTISSSLMGEWLKLAQTAPELSGLIAWAGASVW